jgi:hypothetical protein
VSRRPLLALLAAVLASAALTTGASAGRPFQVGITDDTTVFSNPTKAFETMKALRVQVVRVTLWWGGSNAVATRRPKDPTNPADPAYDWSRYDPIVELAKKNKIQVLFSIMWTPRWANGGKLPKVAPKNVNDLRNFAIAAAKRYSGTFKPAGSDTPLPPVREWLVWNEPNNPVFLYPQYRKVGRNRYTPLAAYNYARMCNAVYGGIHSLGLSGEKVACGATDPRGNNQPASYRPAISPLAFLRAVKHYGLRTFDAWAHHPYAGSPSESPTKPPRAKTSVTLGNIGDLISELTRLYGKKPVWITEYGYQTSPPDRFFGVSWKKQAQYLAQAFSIAQKNPRIQMMVWFLIKDERSLAGWQSGFYTASGKRKPSYTAFQRLRH